MGTPIETKAGYAILEFVTLVSVGKARVNNGQAIFSAEIRFKFQDIECHDIQCEVCVFVVFFFVRDNSSRVQTVRSMTTSTPKPGINYGIGH